MNRRLYVLRKDWKWQRINRPNHMNHPYPYCRFSCLVQSVSWGTRWKSPNVFVKNTDPDESLHYRHLHTIFLSLPGIIRHKSSIFIWTRRYRWYQPYFRSYTGWFLKKRQYIWIDLEIVQRNYRSHQEKCAATSVVVIVSSRQFICWRWIDKSNTAAKERRYITKSPCAFDGTKS